ncbi:MAG: TonB-dependent receptor, partial [Thiomicrospira sp.]|uniref:TonB-dependent receptor plug domain-containing protein n=1 Tax=Thiomicrospira sp. TaxID=935 RepID=UPI0019F52FF7
KPLIAALCLAPGLVMAENTLNNIVVTANQIEQDLDKVTADVTVITAAQLRAKRASSLIEVLNQVSGLSFSQNGGLGTSTSLYMRGSDTQRTLILVDGVRAQDPSNTSGANLSDLMVANIERIEIIKGAQSGVWGSDAAAGVINIITKQSTETQINVEHGAYNTGKSAISTGFKLGDARLFINASHLTTEGHTAQAPVNENINQYEKDGYRNSNITLRAVVPITNNQQLTLAHNSTDALANYDGWGDPDAVKRSKNRTDLSQLSYQATDTKLSLEQSVFSSKQLDEGSPDIVRGQTRNLQLTQQFNDFLVGAAYAENQASSDKYSWSALDNVLLEKQTNSRSVFATHSTRWRYLTFNEALRYDDYSNFGSELTGKLGVRLDINPHQSLAVNYGSAYNAPNIIQILNPWGTANLDLTPEKSTEASLTYKLHGLSITYFDKQISDLIDWKNSQYQNLDGTTKIKGIEAEYARRFNDWGFGVNYTHLNTEDANGDPLSRRPDNQVGLDLNWYPNDQLDINLNGQYIATRGGNVHTATENYSVWNGVINYQIDQSVSAYLKVNNLFNTYYQVVEGYATAERSAYLGLNARF